MRGAIPAGCRLRRSTLTGGRSNSASAPAISIGTARLYETSVQWRSTASAGYGSCPLSTASTALRTASMSGSSSRRSPYIGAYPAAISSRLRSRSGTSSRLASRSSMARLGTDRPLSTKLRWRVETAASPARSSWLR